jgi:hypothetical protein
VYQREHDLVVGPGCVHDRAKRPGPDRQGAVDDVPLKLARDGPRPRLDQPRQLRIKQRLVDREVRPAPSTTALTRRSRMAGYRRGRNSTAFRRMLPSRCVPAATRPSLNSKAFETSDVAKCVAAESPTPRFGCHPLGSPGDRRKAWEQIAGSFGPSAARFADDHAGQTVNLARGWPGTKHGYQRLIDRARG